MSRDGVNMSTKILEKYENDVIAKLMEQFKLRSKMEAPKIEKIVINMGVGKAQEDIKILESAMADLATITGQKPVITRAKKAVANFKLRKGVPAAIASTGVIPKSSSRAKTINPFAFA